MGRKKNSNVKKKSINDSFDEEEAIRIYSRRKSFERTENIGLETTFEEAEEENTKSRASRATKAKLPPKLRMITSQPFFIEDKEKSILRKKQTAKLFKGRKKPKWKGLTAKQEEKLIHLIQNKSDTEDDTDQDEVPASSSPIPNVIPFVTSNSSSDENSILRLTPVTAGQEVNVISEQKNQENMMEIDIKNADDFLGPLGFSDDEDDAEASFKPMKMSNAIKENVQKGDRRKSKIATVRRSSRLFRGEPLKDQSNNLGSVFQDVEITERKKTKRQSNIFVQQSIEPVHETSPIPGEETFSLFKQDNGTVHA